jgi:hypothetical protein
MLRVISRRERNFFTITKVVTKSGKVLVCEQYPLLPWSYSPFFICQEGIALAEVMQDARVLNRVLNYKHKIIVY